MERHEASTQSTMASHHSDSHSRKHQNQPAGKTADHYYLWNKNYNRLLQHGLWHQLLGPPVTSGTKCSWSFLSWQSSHLLFEWENSFLMQADSLAFSVCYMWLDHTTSTLQPDMAWPSWIDSQNPVLDLASVPAYCSEAGSRLFHGQVKDSPIQNGLF